MFIKFEGIPRAFNTDYLVDVGCEGNNVILTTIAMEDFVFECLSKEDAEKALGEVIEGKRHYIYGKFVDVSEDLWSNADVYENGKKVNKPRPKSDDDQPFK